MCLLALPQKLGQVDDFVIRLNHRRALTALLEPFMIVAMGVIVAFIVFSILMPILQINTLAGGT